MRNISFDKTDYPDAHKQIPLSHLNGIPNP